MLPQFGFVNLDALQGRYRSPGSGLGQIGVNFIPPMNAMKPQKLGAKVLTMAETRRAAGAAALPESFSWANPADVSRKLNGINADAIINKPGEQASCGSCFAFSSVSMLQDRWAIATRQSCPPLAVRVACSCLTASDAGPCCEGGQPYDVGAFLETNGVPADACFPYQGSEEASGTSEDCTDLGNVAKCNDPKYMKDGKRITWYAIKGSNAYLTETGKEATPDVIRSNIEKIKNELYANGPVVGAFFVYKDFTDLAKGAPDSWPGGIYKHTGEGGILGGHAIVIVGYGPNWWHIRNSWSTSWNDQGYCKVYDGLNGNGGVGFDHAVANENGQFLGGAYTWLADPKSGVGGYGRTSGSGALTDFTYILKQWWFWLIVVTVIVIIVFGKRKRQLSLT